MNAQLHGSLARYRHLELLEAESIHIFREVAATAQNPVMLFSIGKDSGVMLELARRAFHPAPIPFPLLHIDCRWDFRAMYQLRDELTGRYGLRMLVHASAAADDPAVNPFDLPSSEFTRLTLTESLKEALSRHGFDAAFGGGRRDQRAGGARGAAALAHVRAFGPRDRPRRGRRDGAQEARRLLLRVRATGRGGSGRAPCGGPRSDGAASGRSGSGSDCDVLRGASRDNPTPRARR